MQKTYFQILIMQKFQTHFYQKNLTMILNYLLRSMKFHENT